MSNEIEYPAALSFGDRADEFINTLLHSFVHPLYVINVDTYEIILANAAAYEGRDHTARTCHILTHQSPAPCDSEEHGCPLKEVKRTGKPVQMVHTHFDSAGNPRLYEVHGHPVTQEGRITHMIEYSIDITEKEQALTALKENTRLQEQLIEAQRKEISELSTPIIEIWESLLVLPVVGNITPARGAGITSALLNRVSEKRAHGVIIDVTGIEVMDTTTAALFIKMTKAIRLLGATAIISGISPHISELLVGLDVGLGGAVTHPTLKDALRWFIGVQKQG